MIDLDDERELTARDPSAMLATIGGLPTQCREGYSLGRGIADPSRPEDVEALVVCGMGGSAIAGDSVRALFAGRPGVPIQMIRGSELPGFCGPKTLVVASSYSGETAETIRCLDEAIRRGCGIVVVTSGGTLGARAAELGLPRVTVPIGYMPRAAFGYLLLGLLGALEVLGLIPPVAEELGEAVTELDALVPTLVPSVPTSVNPAKRVAAAIGSRVPVVWGAEGFAAVAAARWKTQFNENAKVPAFSSALPELDHNEVVGWSKGRGTRFFLVALRHDAEPPDVAARFAPSIEIASASGMVTHEVWATGESALTKLLSLVVIGDFASAYLGLARGKDPTPIEAIVRLKQSLTEV
ncbi:MAG: bifunctional phosphoglucose/phosphomannose isomerase [Actinomycetota bacterium]